jgi:hypothetical protein
MNAAKSRFNLAWLLVLVVLPLGCEKKEQPAPMPMSGEALAAIACAQCHTVPSPAHLAHDEWPYLLAWMGNFVGHTNEIPINPYLISRCFLPPRPVVTREQFDAICNYYLDQSVVQYKAPEPRPAPPVSKWFEPTPVATEARVITLVAIDPTNHALLIGSSAPPGLRVSQNGSNAVIEVHSEPITFERLGSVRRIALMGNMSRDAREGQVVDFDLRDGTRRILVDGYPRIAAHCTADLDGDGKDDLVVCGFGDYPVGRVAIEWGGETKTKEQILFEEAGAVWCDAADLDGDGKTDIVIAIGSNRPRILAFVNQGNRRFVPRPVVERTVGWGYNRCVLTDWDGDGRLDLVELTGNNLELRGRPLKPWHGVRVLRNEGDWKFREILFEPLPGAMDIVAGDFDGNGRMDLAVVSFCPDWRLPVPTTFLLLLQRADGTVERAGIDDRFWNRWMRIGAGDVNGDGRVDLILGAADVPVGIPYEHLERYNQLQQGKPAVLVLQNLGPANR